MSMKSRGFMLAAMALAMSVESNAERGITFIPDSEEQKRRAYERNKALMEKKGVKEFTIDGITVYARNYKNAIRKVNNIQGAKLKLK